MQNNKKRINLVVLIIVILALTIGGTLWFINSKKTSTNNNIQKEENFLDFSSKRLVVITDKELTDNYNAKSVNKTNSGKYILKYETEEETKKAYESLKQDSNIQNVNIDINIQLQEVEPMYITYTVSGTSMQSWGIFTMGLNKMQEIINNSTTKNDIVVAVIDTGFDLENEIFKNHNLQSRIDSRYINIIDNSKSIGDDYSVTANGQTRLLGHGTHTGSIVLDATPDNVKVLPIKVSEGGSLSLTYISEGLRYAIDQNVDVINLSLGWKRQSTIKAIENEIQGLIEEAVQKGITVIAAAGNGDNNGVRESTAQIYPVSYNDVIGVAALNSKLITKENNVINYQSYVAAKNSDASNLIYTDFSNYGDAIDYSAPGEFIICLTPTGSVFGNCGIVQGTSHSAPHLAATVATIKSYKKDLSFEQINQILQYYSLDLGTEGRDNDYGYGMPCFKNFQECECNCANCIKIYCTGCECQNCVYNQVAEKVLEKIEITTNPNKTAYEEGEKFDKTGMVVTAVYSDNSKETVTDYAYTPTGSLTKNDTKITITYKDKNATVTITVKEKTPPVVEKTLEKIEVTKNPNKTAYEEGEKFDKTGMVVTAVYSDNSKETVTDYAYTPTGSLTKNDKRVIITYKDKTATVTITVKEKTPPVVEKTLERIEVTTNPNKTAYEEGERFDKTGMVVTAVYSDNSRETVTDYTYAPTGSLTANDKRVIITYKDKTATVTITVKEKTPPVVEKTLERIEITKNPNKTEYEEGEKFDKTGMVVTAVYSDNSKETVTDYTYTPTGSLTANDKRVIITYKGKTTTISISVKKIEKVLERLEITAPPSKTTYKEGEKFDSTGMVVTAIYSDGTREIITNYNCFPVVELTTSNDKITVSYTYQGKTVTQTYAIEVKAKQSNNNNSGSNDNSGNNNNNTGNNNGGNSNNDNTIGNNNMNFITVKDNTNNSNNNTSIPKNTNTDNTIKGGTIANTGLETIIIIPIAIITIIGTVAFINYKRYKDI